jgi:Spy/CpxP family protein refolding chaperone
MKTKIIILNLTMLVLLVGGVQAQVEEPNPNPAANQNVRPFRLMQALGLTREQVQQIRLINQDRKTVVMEAQRRWRSASRELDNAIYSENVDEENIKELTKRAQLAQAELLKEKTVTEYLIRKVLTPVQLVKFRELREQMAQRMANRNQQGPKSQTQSRPIERLQERRNQSRPQ